MLTDLEFKAEDMSSVYVTVNSQWSLKLPVDSAIVFSTRLTESVNG